MSEQLTAQRVFDAVEAGLGSAIRNKSDFPHDAVNWGDLRVIGVRFDGVRNGWIASIEEACPGATEFQRHILFEAYNHLPPFARLDIETEW